jgi:hypothetical protein
MKSLVNNFELIENARHTGLEIHREREERKKDREWKRL